MNRSKLIFYASAGAFITYFSMYAFRKPFTAGLFEGMAFWGVDYKILLVTFQLIGYASSKLIGIRFISELDKTKRIYLILGLVIFSWIALLLFSLTPAPMNAIFLLLNGLPLGLIWGIVFSFLEGRKLTELLAAGLSVSFIVSSGSVKTIGRWLIEFGISEFWMPVVTGVLFFPFLILGVWMLSLIPEPSLADRKARTVRPKMDKQSRRAFIRMFFPGLAATVILYLSLTMFRDVRDNFAVDIWDTLGYLDVPSILTTTEAAIAGVILLIAGSLFLIKSNIKALQINLIIIPACAVLMISSLLLYQYSVIGPVLWMILMGFSMYLPYITYHTMLLERWIAAFKVHGNVGFLMYIMDSVGYLGAIAILVVKNYISPEMDWGTFFIQLSWGTALIMLTFGVYSSFYFTKKLKLSLTVSAKHEFSTR